MTLSDRLCFYANKLAIPGILLSAVPLWTGTIQAIKSDYIDKSPIMVEAETLGEEISDRASQARLMKQTPELTDKITGLMIERQELMASSEFISAQENYDSRVAAAWDNGFNHVRYGVIGISLCTAVYLATRRKSERFVKEQRNTPVDYEAARKASKALQRVQARRNEKPRVNFSKLVARARRRRLKKELELVGEE